MTGYQSKKTAAQDKLVVTDLDGHVVRDVRKPKKAARDRDAEIERLNEKIEFLARTNMLYSDWEHRETQVTSDLIRKGIEEAKINAELRAEIAELKAQLVAQPAQEPVAWYHNDFNVVELSRIPRAGWKPLFTTPQQRPWVGLTDEEIALIDWESLTTKKDCVRAIEAKLKEKNT